MVELRATVLYTRRDLAEMLAPAGVDVDHFLARLGARKVFKQLWLGADLIEAYRCAPELTDKAGAKCRNQQAEISAGANGIAISPAILLANRGRRRKKSTTNPLDELMQKMRQK